MSCHKYEIHQYTSVGIVYPDVLETGSLPPLHPVPWTTRCLYSRARIQTNVVKGESLWKGNDAAFLNQICGSHNWMSWSSHHFSFSSWIGRYVAITCFLQLCSLGYWICLSFKINWNKGHQPVWMKFAGTGKKIPTNVDASGPGGRTVFTVL